MLTPARPHNSRRTTAERPQLPSTACAVDGSERRLMPTRALPLRCRLASAKVRSDHLPCMGTPHSAVSPLTIASTAMTWSSACRGSIRSSFLVRGVETQNDLDDRALPDRLRSLHRHLDGH